MNRGNDAKLELDHFWRNRCMQSRRSGTVNTAHGAVTKYSVRTAKSGNYAHEFNLGSKRYSLFSNEAIVPFQDGDVVRFDFRAQRLKSGSGSEYFSVILETLELIIPNQPETPLAGFVYILSNPSMTGLLKIGFTTGSPEGRAAELSAVTGVPKPFRVEWAHPVTGNPRAVEQRTHAQLSHLREGKEFFRVTVNEAKAIVVEADRWIHPDATSGTQNAISRRQTEFGERRERHLLLQEQRKYVEGLERFWESPLGEWLSIGSVKLTVSRFKEKPEGRATGFVSSMFGKKTKPWANLRVIGRNNYPLNPWRVLVNGVLDNQNVDFSQDCATLTDAINLCKPFRPRFSSENFEAVIQIGNQLRRSPDCYGFDIRFRHEAIPVTLSQLEFSDPTDQLAINDFVKIFQ